MKFLRKILDGRKSYLKVSNVKFLRGYERYKSLKMETIIPEALNKFPVLRNYFPDDVNTKLIDRNWSYSVTLTLI